MINLKKLIEKTLKNPNLKPKRYVISDNGSTVYAKDKKAAREKAQELVRKIKELQGT